VAKACAGGYLKPPGLPQEPDNARFRAGPATALAVAVVAPLRKQKRGAAGAANGCFKAGFYRCVKAEGCCFRGKVNAVVLGPARLEAGLRPDAGIGVIAAADDEA